MTAAQNSQQSRQTDPIPRRAFLRQSVSAVSVAATFHALLQRSAAGTSRHQSSWGPPIPIKDETTGLELLKLPEGFRYLSFGWQHEAMHEGTPTPANHDGMAVIAEGNGRAILCRNHEVNFDGEPFAREEITFDPHGPGGCVLLEFDTEEGRLVKSWPGISGTSRNCAGGPTPWGSWLTCEETVLGPGGDYHGMPVDFQKDHGWIFEVPAEEAASPVPLKDMGRFVHEAVAVGAETGIVYETEDRQTAGFYRFLPRHRGQLARGGRLQMMQVHGEDDLRQGHQPGDTFDVTWVDIEEPRRAHSPGTEDTLGVFQQGKRQGGTTFARLEGCWAAGEDIYFVSTNGGAAQRGQVWQYRPKQEQLRLLFESPRAEVLDYPDNVTVSPRGGLILCEDGKAGPDRMHGLTPDGRLIPFAENHVVLKGEKNGFRGDFRRQEWAGACFSQDGRWLFANIQTPGITFAITGPWQEENV